MDFDVSSVNEFLKELRNRRGLTLREAAERSGLSHSYISSLEAGKHPKTKAPINPSPDSLKGLSDAYNYPYEELMKIAGYIEEKKENSKQELADELLRYIDNGLSNEEIKKRMDFFAEFIQLNNSQVDELLSWVRWQLSKKKEQASSSIVDES